MRNASAFTMLATVALVSFGAVHATGCSAASSGGDAGGSAGEQCVAIDAGSSCEGQTITFCSTQAPGASTCTNAYYRVGERTIPCQSCSSTDLESCGAQATMACTPEGGSTSGDAGAD